MKLHKRILNQNWAQSLVTGLVTMYLRLVHATGHWDHRGWQNIQAVIDQKKPIVLCYWHGRLVNNIFGWPNDAPPLHQLSTAHRDGKLAGKTYQNFGIIPVWLDSKSPTEATRKIVKILKTGGIFSITPDGPKGPRQRLSKSTIDLARLGGATLVPVSSSSSRAKTLNTWDRMQFPLPFSRGAFQFGTPVEVPRKATAEDLEHIRQHVEDDLNNITRDLDQEFHQQTPQPAPLPDTTSDTGDAS